VVGCHRSGTNLLYDVLLSAGGFAVYRGYLPIYKMLITHYGPIRQPANSRKIVEAWLHSKGFRASGLDAADISVKLNEGCRNGADFIRVVMDEIARQQKVPRWAVYDPDNLLYMPAIKADLPAALFVHIVRDGRDVALSLKKMGGFRPIPWHRKPASLEATALYWRWMVENGRRNGRKFPGHYLEIRYEELVTDPQNVLQKLGPFLGQELDYAQIQDKKLGRLSQSNSSFRESGAPNESNPIERWKRMLSAEEVAVLEDLIGNCLQESGYELAAPQPKTSANLRRSWMRAIYPPLLDAKFWLKTRTRAGRWSNLSALELSDVPDDEHI